MLLSIIVVYLSILNGVLENEKPCDVVQLEAYRSGQTVSVSGLFLDRTILTSAKLWGEVLSDLRIYCPRSIVQTCQNGDEVLPDLRFAEEKMPAANVFLDR